MDEPESTSGIALAAEKLDNLIFVINCNLQRLDGPVRGNDNIIANGNHVFEAPAGVSSKSYGTVLGPLFAQDKHGLRAHFSIARW